METQEMRGREPDFRKMEEWVGRPKARVRDQAEHPWKIIQEAAYGPRSGTPDHGADQ